MTTWERIISRSKKRRRGKEKRRGRESEGKIPISGYAQLRGGEVETWVRSWPRLWGVTK